MSKQAHCNKSFSHYNSYQLRPYLGLCLCWRGCDPQHWNVIWGFAKCHWLCEIYLTGELRKKGIKTLLKFKWISLDIDLLSSVWQYSKWNEAFKWFWFLWIYIFCFAGLEDLKKCNPRCSFLVQLKSKLLLIVCFFSLQIFPKWCYIERAMFP